MTSIDQSVRSAVNEQIQELEQVGLGRLAAVNAALRELKNAKDILLIPSPSELETVLDRAIATIGDVASSVTSFDALASALGDVETLAVLMSGRDLEERTLIARVYVHVQRALNRRPDVEAVIQDLDAVKSLRGGPADVTALHDFHVLQIAFKSVWQHAFDKNVQSLVEQLYLEHTQLFEDAGLELPPFGSIADIAQLEQFLGISLKSIDPPQDLMVANPEYEAVKPIWESISSMFGALVPATIPKVDLPTVMATFQAGWVWWQLSAEQQYWVWEKAAIVNDPATSDAEKEEARKIANAIMSNPEGPGGRIVKLIYKLGRALSEPYAFDVFAKDSYNFGQVITYRQRWEPGPYQAGNLVSTIPLAPGESRKYTKKQLVKTSRAVKEVEKTLKTNSFQSSETSRDELEILNKVAMSTNYKMSSNASVSMGVASFGGGVESGGMFGMDTSEHKKDFHEKTIKAANEYRLERSIEVDETSSSEYEATSAGEISNPNNEITVTYLFYELQRRYTISEYLYRVRPVILVALDVPAPHEIDESWLLQYQWIISRVLLDDSFRTALNYLSSGFAGDEVSVQILRSNWERQRDVFNSQDKVVADLVQKRDWLREAVVTTQLQADTAKSFEVNEFVNVLSFGMANKASDMAADQLEASNAAYKARLEYVDSAIEDAQGKLRQASETLQQATKEYAAALQSQFSRRVSIDQLRLHVKQNILHYMQAVWSHMVADQVFLDLYNLEVEFPTPSSSTLTLTSNSPLNAAVLNSTYVVGMPAPSDNWTKHQLVEVADIDNPLGFKGNYIVLPLKDQCYLTSFMLQAFIDEETAALMDPDEVGSFLEEFDSLWIEAKRNTVAKFRGEALTQAQLKERLKDYVKTGRRGVDEIIVPTGQLFIEALPGSHPLLEDFKLLHRVEDVRKVRAEVRRSELENLRMAERIFEGNLGDPTIDKKVIIQGSLPLSIATDG